jgi:hypothetical protein
MVPKDIERGAPGRTTWVAVSARSTPASAAVRKRQWRAEVLGAFTCAREDGAPVVIPPGDYVLSEIDDVQYQLADTSRVWARFWFTQVRQLKRSGALRIEGTFP